MGTVYSVSAVDAATDKLTITGHARSTGDGPACIYVANGDAPGGLTALADVWLIVVDADHVKVATSSANALAGTAIDITSTGSGAIKLFYGIPYRRARTYAVDVQLKSADLNDTQDAQRSSHGPWPHGAAAWIPYGGASNSTTAGFGAPASVDLAGADGAYSHMPEAVPGLKIGSIDCIVKTVGTVTVQLMRQKYDGSNASVVATASSTNLAWSALSVAANHTVEAGYAYWLTVSSAAASHLLMATVVPG